MHPAKVDRARLHTLTDLPNVGRAMADDLRLLGYFSPAQIAGEDPFEMYQRLCRRTGLRQDPCVIDVFVSVTRFLAGEPAQPWWAYTAARKQAMRER